MGSDPSSAATASRRRATLRWHAAELGVRAARLSIPTRSTPATASGSGRRPELENAFVLRSAASNANARSAASAARSPAANARGSSRAADQWWASSAR